jgi:hypothetical protein
MDQKAIIKKIEKLYYSNTASNIVIDPKKDFTRFPGEPKLGYKPVAYAHRAQRKKWVLYVYKEEQSSDLMVRIVIVSPDGNYRDRQIRDAYFFSKHAIINAQCFTDEFFTEMSCPDKKLDIEDLVLNAGVKSVEIRDKKRSEESKQWKALNYQRKKEIEKQEQLRQHELWVQRYRERKNEAINNSKDAGD